MYRRLRRSSAKTRPRRFFETGAGLVEYALIIALIAVLAIGATTYLGGQIKGVLSNVGTAAGNVLGVQGGPGPGPVAQPGDFTDQSSCQGAGFIWHDSHHGPDYCAAPSAQDFNSTRPARLPASIGTTATATAVPASANDFHSAGPAPLRLLWYNATAQQPAANRPADADRFGRRHLTAASAWQSSAYAEPSRRGTGTPTWHAVHLSYDRLHGYWDTATGTMARACGLVASNLAQSRRTPSQLGLRPTMSWPSPRASSFICPRWDPGLPYRGDTGRACLSSAGQSSARGHRLCMGPSGALASGLKSIGHRKPDKGWGNTHSSLRWSQYWRSAQPRTSADRSTAPCLRSAIASRVR